MILFLLCGAGTGLGLWLLVIGWVPRPLRLDKALDAPYGRARRTQTLAAAPVSGWAGRWGRPAASWLHRAGLPSAATRRDLATVDKPVDVHLAEQVTATVLGVLVPPVFAGLLTAAGSAPGFTMPAVASLVLGVAGFLAPELSVRSEAAAYRAAFRDALSSFLDLVVISLAAGSGVDQALDDAAQVGSGPAYAEIRYALTEARLARLPPWDILATLGERVAVAELQQLAATVGMAGTEGARVRSSLRSRAIALRERQLTDAEGDANAATERMALPIVALFAGFLIFLGYPALAAVLGGPIKGSRVHEFRSVFNLEPKGGNGFECSLMAWVRQPKAACVGPLGRCRLPPSVLDCGDLPRVALFQRSAPYPVDVVSRRRTWVRGGAAGTPGLVGSMVLKA